MFDIEATKNVLEITWLESTGLPCFFEKHTKNCRGNARVAPYFMEHKECVVFNLDGDVLTGRHEPCQTTYVLYREKWYKVKNHLITKLDASELPGSIKSIINRISLSQAVTEIIAHLPGGLVRYIEKIGTVLVTPDQNVIYIGCPAAADVCVDAGIIDADGKILPGPYAEEAFQEHEREIYQLHQKLVQG